MTIQHPRVQISRAPKMAGTVHRKSRRIVVECLYLLSARSLRRRSALVAENTRPTCAESMNPVLVERHARTFRLSRRSCMQEHLDKSEMSQHTSQYDKTALPNVHSDQSSSRELESEYGPTSLLLFRRLGIFVLSTFTQLFKRVHGYVEMSLNLLRTVNVSVVECIPKESSWCHDHNIIYVVMTNNI